MRRLTNRLLNFAAGALLVFMLTGLGGACLLLPSGENRLVEGVQGLVAQLVLATCRFNLSRFDSSCIFQN